MSATANIPSSSPDIKQEQEVWVGHTSQLVNAWYILGAVYGFWLIYPLYLAVWKFLEVRCHKHVLTTAHLSEDVGVFNIQQDHMDLDRITDIRVRAHLLQRCFGLGDVEILSNDMTHKTHTLKSIHNPKHIADLIKDHVRKLNPNGDLDIFVS